MPIPTPSATFPVVDKPDEDCAGAAVEEGEDSDGDELAASEGVALEALALPVLVGDEPWVLVEVDVGSVILKKEERKPSGPSGLIQIKKTLE